LASAGDVLVTMDVMRSRIKKLVKGISESEIICLAQLTQSWGIIHVTHRQFDSQHNITFIGLQLD